MTFESGKGSYVAKRANFNKRRLKKINGDYEGTYAPDPPPISDSDINRGMINLVNRGTIPKDVDLTPAFERGAPPLLMRPAKIHLLNPAVEAKREIAVVESFKNALKFDFQPVQKIDSSSKRRKDLPTMSNSLVPLTEYQPMLSKIDLLALPAP